ncbi:MAG: SAM-dependent methyltransferase [Candidatus Acidiferrales bacterium]|jgi:methyltransferase (TIGR00027 family)
MSESQSAIRNISDTALWVAVYRARETDRPDAVFRDPFARRLAGERGERIAQSMSFGDEVAWTWAARTYLFDSFISEQVQQGADLVINLAAGLDARPYRMELPASLRWIEVDLPDILSYKEEILRGEKPVCSLERVPLDLSDRTARRRALEKLGEGRSRVLVVTEGLILYLSAEDVGALAQDLAAVPALHRWVLDLVSPGLLRMAQKVVNPQLGGSGASLKFGPEEGPLFFERYGWTPADVRSLLKTAARLKRLPFRFRLMALLPESKGKQGSRPWQGICLLKKRAAD